MSTPANPVVELMPGPPPTPLISRRRWWLHLVLIGLYPVLTVGLGYAYRRESHGPALPSTVAGLLGVAFTELIVFSLVFALGWLASRATADQLMLRWRGGVKPFLLGAGYSVALRIGIAILAIIAVVGYFIYTQAKSGPQTEQQSKDRMEQFASKVRPKPEVLMDLSKLGEDPVYFALVLTLISFVVAGLREELWRAGVLAAFAALFPLWYKHWAGKLLAVFLVAIVFGLCHLPQGWGAVVMTGILGLGLGAIMVFHDSIWPAVLAHGFFDASTFVMIYLIGKYLPGAIPGM